MEIETKLSKASMHKTMLCLYRHDGVWCDEFSFCWKCGWHPKIEAERKKKIRESLAPVVVTERPRYILGSGSYSQVEKVDI